MDTHHRLPKLVLSILTISLFSLAEPAPTPLPIRDSEAVPQEGQRVSIQGCAGKVGGSVRLAFPKVAQPAVQIELTCVDMPNRNHHWAMTPVPAGLKDAALAVRLTGAHGWGPRVIERIHFIRPDLHFCSKEDVQRMSQEWDRYPPASEHPFDLAVVRRNEAVEIWLDGRYFASFPAVEGCEAFGIQAAKGATVNRVIREADTETVEFLPVNLSAYPCRGKTPIKNAPVPTGPATIDGIPFRVVSPEHHVDVGLSRWFGQDRDSDSFYDPYYMRSCWDGVPESILLGVPKRPFRAVHLICAVDTAGDRSPEMGVRVARYLQVWDGGGAMQADTNVVVDPSRSEGCTLIRKIGSVTAEDASGPRALPLYHVAIPLKTGELADILHTHAFQGYDATDFFYLEFGRSLATRVRVNSGIFEVKPLGPKPGIYLLAATLEKAPAQIIVTSDQPGNVLYRDQQPCLKVEMTNPTGKDIPLRLTARIADFLGEAQTLKQSVTATPGQSEAAISLARLDAGWYSAEFVFTDGRGRPVWTQPITFALLPPDRRQAGNESPFGTWWFCGSHYTEGDPEKVLPLLQRMGFRHVTPPRYEAKTGYTSENFARFKVSPSMMNYVRDAKSPEDLRMKIRKYMEEWPSTRFAMIFHETGGLSTGIGLPPELLGEPPYRAEGKDKEPWEKLYAGAVSHAEAIREAAPQVKIILGNGGTPFNVHWLREKFPRKYWDAVGMEMAIQTFCPEGQPTGWNLQGLWIAKRMREIYDYADFPIASCYEFDYRSTAAGGLSLERQANWYARDVLHCLAYRMPSINVALIVDCNSSYYSSRWGATGLCFRSPWNLPKPSYVALAALTQALDQAEYQRYLDTGSHSLYALEFRKGAGWVYAIWTTDGQREVSLSLQTQDGQCTVTDSMGRESQPKTRKGTIGVTASESPVYVATGAPVTAVRASPATYRNAELRSPTVLRTLNQPERWKVVQEGEPRVETFCGYTPLRKATAQLSAASKGTVRLTLDPQPDLPDPIGRCVTLEPKDGPVSIPGEPDAIAVWVNGNSNWGRVIFEILDAQDRIWTSNGWEEEPGSWDMSDWEGDTCIRFDGWRLISVGMPLHYPSGYYRPEFRHWRCLGDNSRTNRLAYPLKFRRLYVIMREKLVYVTDMVPAKSLFVEFRDVTAGQMGDTHGRH